MTLKNDAPLTLWHCLLFGFTGASHPSSLGRRWLVGRLRTDLVGALGPYDAVCIFWVLDEVMSRISARLRGWSNVFFFDLPSEVNPAFNFIVLACVMGLSLMLSS